jgi:hypothetical protein
MPGDRKVAGSFRDPNGFLFWEDGVLYRQVNALYKEHYDHLMESGLYEHLVAAGLLIPHAEADADLAVGEEAYKVLQPDLIPFVAYPYEWCFSHLKDAALATLEIQRRALDFGMTLKDSSAYNIQFVGGKPVLIDTLSFETYQEGTIWVPYRQYCQHFLAPLALMSLRDVRLGQLLRLHIDGVPLDLAASLLPRRSRLRPGLLAHIFAHARSQKAFAGREVDTQAPRRTMSRQSLLGLVESLRATTARLDWQPSQTAWADYYEGDSYEAQAFEHKKQLVADFLAQAAPDSVWDLGANTGVFSRIASAESILTIAWDVDPGAVEQNYQRVKADGERHLLPLVLDLTNPSPAIGWANTERQALLERDTPDAALALALIHHLAIANNVPLDDVAAFLARLTKWLVIEFVPKDDPKVQTLLAAREDIFPNYTESGFEAAFSKHFSIVRSEQINHSERRLYLMKGK